MKYKTRAMTEDDLKKYQRKVITFQIIVEAALMLLFASIIAFAVML